MNVSRAELQRLDELGRVLRELVYRARSGWSVTLAVARQVEVVDVQPLCEVRPNEIEVPPAGAKTVNLNESDSFAFFAVAQRDARAKRRSPNRHLLI